MFVILQQHQQGLDIYSIPSTYPNSLTGCTCFAILTVCTHIRAGDPDVYHSGCHLASHLPLDQVIQLITTLADTQPFAQYRLVLLWPCILPRHSPCADWFLRPWTWSIQSPGLTEAGATHQTLSYNFSVYGSYRILIPIRIFVVRSIHAWTLMDICHMFFCIRVCVCAVY